jgi:hypothetical protein
LGQLSGRAVPPVPWGDSFLREGAAGEEKRLMALFSALALPEQKNTINIEKAQIPEKREGEIPWA